MRSLRRHHYRRLKNKRKIYWCADMRPGGLNSRQLGMVATTPQICSCFGCGNQRQYHGPKTKEKAK